MNRKAGLLTMSVVPFLGLTAAHAATPSTVLTKQNATQQAPTTVPPQQQPPQSGAPAPVRPRVVAPAPVRNGVPPARNGVPDPARNGVPGQK